MIERNGIQYELITPKIVEVTKKRKKLGNIYINPGDWELIINGTDPIEEGWENGNGTPLNKEGWE